MSCNYQGRDFGATYPDSICIDGFLWDADCYEGGLYTSGGDIPCPECNHDAWLEYYRDDIEEEGYIAFMEGKTVDAFPYTDGKGLRYKEDQEKVCEMWLSGFREAMEEER